eukprot:IDg6918t1
MEKREIGKEEEKKKENRKAKKRKEKWRKHRRRRKKYNTDSDNSYETVSTSSGEYFFESKAIDFYCALNDPSRTRNAETLLKQILASHSNISSYVETLSIKQVHNAMNLRTLARVTDLYIKDQGLEGARKS